MTPVTVKKILALIAVFLAKIWKSLYENHSVCALDAFRWFRYGKWLPYE